MQPLPRSLISLWVAKAAKKVVRAMSVGKVAGLGPGSLLPVGAAKAVAEDAVLRLTAATKVVATIALG